MTAPNGTIFQALIAVKRAVKAVGKSDRNAQQGFDFRGIDAVLNAVSPALVDAGITVIPELKAISYGSLPTRSGGEMTTVRVEVAYHFYGPDGSVMTAVVPAESFDTGDKATTKAMSVAYRTALIQVLSLPTQERDPDADVYERAAVAHEPGALPPPPARDWIAEIRSPNNADMDSLLALGRECHAAGAFVGEVKAAMLKRREELLAAAGQT